jgi:type II secretory pathway predicted ATPase ExeA/LysM repeat protein
MVLNYYQLAEQPFGVTPDPRLLYMSATHREAIASVLYSVRAGRGFTALIAEPGMGKTTVLFNLLQQLGDSAKTAFLFQSQDTPKNFLRNLLQDLGVEDDGQDLASMQTKLNDCLVRETSQGKSILVVVDEAQNLDEPVLEVVRMLSNFETPREKLMHIILAGQPQLASKLALPQLTQLRQRISTIARLKPFSAAETRAYIEHRLRVSGYRSETPLFTDHAYSLIAKYSAGIPRNINNLCFNAMSLGCAMKQRTIHAAAVEEVLTDLDLAPLREVTPVTEFRQKSVSVPGHAPGWFAGFIPKSWWLKAGIAALAVSIAGIGLAGMVKSRRSETPTSAIASGNSITPQQKTSVGSEISVGPTDISASPEKTDESVDSVSTPQSGAPVVVESAASIKKLAPAADSVMVRVGPKDTLYKICVDNLGRYDAQVEALVYQLNPGLEKPRLIRSGQEIRIPTPGGLVAQSDFSEKQLGNTSALEAKKP